LDLPSEGHEFEALEMANAFRRIQYKIVYKPEKQNVNADSLSRYPEVHLCDMQEPEMNEERKQKIISEIHDCPISWSLRCVKDP
jgi:hypothetical protein